MLPFIAYRFQLQCVAEEQRLQPSAPTAMTCVCVIAELWTPGNRYIWIEDEQREIFTANHFIVCHLLHVGVTQNIMHLVD